MSLEQNIASHSGKPVAIFDLDGTLITAHVWQCLVKHQVRRRINLLPALAYPLVHYPLYPLARVGLIDVGTFRRIWAERMPWLVAGMSIEQGQHLFDDLVREALLPTLRDKVLLALRQHQEQGYEIILLSGTFEPLLAAFGKAIGVTRAAGTRLQTSNGRYTGRGLAPLCMGAGKVARLRQYLAEAGIGVDWSSSYAYADYITDVPVLALVGHPVAVAPDEQLRQHARQVGWCILE
ncbi:MAG: HAD family hydrolase [Anaerolineae bacterium]